MTPSDSTVAFAELGLRPELLTALDNAAHITATPIQAQAIPLLLEGSDLLGQAATGTGKTAAFALPILERIDGKSLPNTPQALVLAPTRELASQVADATKVYGEEMKVRVSGLVGGSPIGPQIGALERGVHIAVATPGRALDLINRGHLDVSMVATVVLDEADEMLDLGFAEELEAILDATPKERQTVLFSATMPPRIAALAQKHLNDPATVSIKRDDSNAASLVEHHLHFVHRGDKARALSRVLATQAPTATLVFCRTRDDVDQLVELLGQQGHRAQALHGGMSQEQRTIALNRLRSGAADLVVATDVAARGLHIDHLSHVVNMDVPNQPEVFVHRTGRVGRAGRTGVAITFATPSQRRGIAQIVDVTGIQLQPEPVPSAEQLRAARVTRLGDEVVSRLATNDALHAQLAEMVRSMADDHDVVDIAAAALAMSLRTDDADQHDIPDATRRQKPDRDKGKFGDKKFDKRDKFDRNKKPSGPMTTLKVDGGKHLGIRPKDLVGAIAGETGLRGNQIGSIDVKAKFSLVDVPAKDAERVIKTMNGASIRGKKLSFKRDRPKRR